VSFGRRLSSLGLNRSQTGQTYRSSRLAHTFSHFHPAIFDSGNLVVCRCSFSWRRIFPDSCMTCFSIVFPNVTPTSHPFPHSSFFPRILAPNLMFCITISRGGITEESTAVPHWSGSTRFRASSETDLGALSCAGGLRGSLGK
jgi:hypothetical protein